VENGKCREVGAGGCRGSDGQIKKKIKKKMRSWPEDGKMAAKKNTAENAILRFYNTNCL